MTLVATEAVEAAAEEAAEWRTYSQRGICSGIKEPRAGRLNVRALRAELKRAARDRQDQYD